MTPWMRAMMTTLLLAGPAMAQNVPGPEDAVLTSEMTGAPVFGPAGGQFGAIGALVLDPQGKVEAALVDVGEGMLGLGGKRVLLPLGSLTIKREPTTGALTVHSAATADELEAMPGVE